jgi:predicted component of type VI protein secretion system
VTAAPGPPGTGTSPDGPAPGGTRIEAGALLRRAAAVGSALAGPHLVIREPRTGERVVALDAGGTVGRGAAAALRLADPSASRLHLRLHVDAAGALVEDLGSRNGLRINGRSARGLRRLRSGDRLVVGETLLRYVDPLEQDGGGPAPPTRRPGPATLLGASAALLALAALALALPPP